MSYHSRLSRRQLLAAAGVAAAGTAVAVIAPAASAEAAPTNGRWTGPRTQNGWPVVNATKIREFPVEGSNARVTLLAGDTATVLLHVARRFHYEIAALGAGDVHGHTVDRTVAAPLESNYLSGTAIAIQLGNYPARSAGNMFPQQLIVIRDVLAECGGVVRWGGDDKTCPKEGHFQIDVAPGDKGLAQIAAKISAWNGEPGAGAGTSPDPLQPTRRSAAKLLERKQQKS